MYSGKIFKELQGFDLLNWYESILISINSSFYISCISKHLSQRRGPDKVLEVLYMGICRQAFQKSSQEPYMVRYLFNLLGKHPHVVYIKICSSWGNKKRVCNRDLFIHVCTWENGDGWCEHLVLGYSEGLSQNSLLFFWA